MTDPKPCPDCGGGRQLKLVERCAFCDCTRADPAPINTVTTDSIRNLLKAHGGRFHGPHVEHLSIEEQAFWRFIQSLTAQCTDAARAEVERLERRVAHCENWYATRLEPIKDLAKEAGIWPQVAAVIANGSVTGCFDGNYVYTPPTYAQQLNRAEGLLDLERRRTGQLRALIVTLRDAFKSISDNAACSLSQYEARQALAAANKHLEGK